MNRDQLGVMISTPQAPEDAAEFAHIVEGAGFRRAWLAETTSMEVASVGAAILRETGLEIGTSIVPVYSRSPAVLAMIVATWAGLGGPEREIHLGIGAGGQAIVERWHGIAFERPARTVQDTISILRQAFAGERTDHPGEMRRSEGFQLAGGPVPKARIHIGGMGPRMRKLAAVHADGLILTWISPRVLADLATEFDVAIKGAERDRSQAKLIARAYVAVGDDVDAVREGVRRELVGYLTSPPYARYFSSVGFSSEVEATAEAFERGDREGTAAAVTERMLDELVVAGDRDWVGRRLQEYFDAGADEVIVQPVGAEQGGDPAQTIQALGELLEGNS